MERRKPRWWWIFLATYLVAFVFFAATTPGALSSGDGLSVAAILSTVVAIAGQVAFYLLWPTWKAVADKAHAEGGWTGVTQSMRNLSWTRVLGVVLTSKVFFLASCTGGMALVQMSDKGIESGPHGERVQALDKRMSVIAIIPVPGKANEGKVVRTSLAGLEQFRKDNLAYSFLPPPGKSELSDPKTYTRTEYSVTAAGPGKVMVQTIFHDDENHVLARYAATNQEIEPLYTRTNHDFADFMNGMVLGLVIASALGLLGAFLKWRLKRTEAAQDASTRA